MESSHRETLAHFRSLINFMLDHLEEDMLLSEPPEKSHVAFWWGSRESAVSVLTKLAQVYLRLVPLERKIAPSDEQENDATDEKDYEIIQRYVDKITGKED